MSEQNISTFKPSQAIKLQKHLVFLVVIIIWCIIPPRYLNVNLIAQITPFHLLCIATIIAFFYSLMCIFEVMSISYELTTERLIIYEGILTRRRKQIELYRVHDMEVISPLYLNVFGLSNIVIHSSDATDPIFTILAVNDGYKKCDIIRDNVEIMREAKRVYQMG